MLCITGAADGPPPPPPLCADSVVMGPPWLPLDDVGATPAKRGDSGERCRDVVLTDDRGRTRRRCSASEALAPLAPPLPLALPLPLAFSAAVVAVACVPVPRGVMDMRGERERLLDRADGWDCWCECCDAATCGQGRREKNKSGVGNEMRARHVSKGTSLQWQGVGCATPALLQDRAHKSALVLVTTRNHSSHTNIGHFPSSSFPPLYTPA